MFSIPDDLSRALSTLPPANDAWRQAAEMRQATLTKPAGSLGRLEELAVMLAGWGDDPTPCCTRVSMHIFAGNHGVTAKGVSAFPPEVTAQMVENFRAGGAAINQLTKALDIELHVTPLLLDRPTADISEGPAMTEAETLDALNFGAAAVDDAPDVLALGEMGIGNTTIAAALCGVVSVGDAARFAGPGTGLDDNGVAHKAAIVQQAVTLHRQAARGNAFETLRRCGGRETAAIAGAIVAARLKRIPVIIDGYVVTASLAALHSEAGTITEHCIAAHRSAEPAHQDVLARLGLDPLLDLGMRLGEGSGAAVAVPLLRAAVAAHNGMATFAEAAVSNRDA